MTTIVRVCVVLLALAIPGQPAAQSASPAPERVVVPSGNLRLNALVWKPAAPGPWPAVLFTHGSGRADPAGAHAIGPVFARHGYVFLYVFRRGSGLSAGQGDYMGDLLDREEKARGADARARLQLVMLTTDHLDDVMAGLAVLKKNVANVDSTRIAVGGHSFGGQLALLAAERDSTLRAAVTFAPAALAWTTSAELRNRLVSAVRNIKMPMFFTYAANDYSTTAGETFAAELTRLGRPFQLKIYPAVGETPAAGHNAVHSDVATWEGDVFRFLDANVRKP